MRIADPEPAPDRRAERHDGRAAGLLEATGENRVVPAVGEHDKAFFHELLRCPEELDRVGKQCDLIADDLQLHPVRAEGLAAEPRREYCVAGGETPRSVGQHPHATCRHHVEDRSACCRVEAAEGDGDKRGSRRRNGGFEHLEAGSAAGAHDQARGEHVARDD